jgi:hypothetical protein
MLLHLRHAFVVHLCREIELRFVYLDRLAVLIEQANLDVVGQRLGSEYPVNYVLGHILV